MKFIIANNATAELGVMLEPLCNRIDVPPGGKAEVEFEADEDPIQIDVHDDTFLSIWIPSVGTLRLID